MTGGKGWILSKKLGSLALTVWEWKGFEGKGSVSEWNNHEDVCRRAPATPGIFKYLHNPANFTLGYKMHYVLSTKSITKSWNLSSLTLAWPNKKKWIYNKKMVFGKKEDHSLLNILVSVLLSTLVERFSVSYKRDNLFF